jgi:pimeloyl-ACP methyl ester carboxylesterase
LLGGSEAGPIATLFAATYPERVIALVLVAAMVKWSAAPDLRAAMTDEDERITFDYLDEYWVSGLSGESWYAPSLLGDRRARGLSGGLNAWPGARVR